MPQTVINIKPKPIKTHGILMLVEAPNTSASGVGDTSSNTFFSLSPIDKFELGSSVGVGSAFLVGVGDFTGVDVGVLVGVALGAGVGVLVGVGVLDGVGVFVAEGAFVGVGVGV